MKRNWNRKWLPAVLLSFVLSLLACGQFEIGMQPDEENLPAIEIVAATQVPALEPAAEITVIVSKTEDTPPAAPDDRLRAVGWYGRVSSTEPGVSHDDRLVLYPKEAGVLGLKGADDIVEAQIVALRDSGKGANFWGDISCGVDDVGGCRLLVERLRVDGPGEFFDPDPVEGWVGTLHANQPGSQVDDYFMLAGDYSVHYGIISFDPAISSQLVLLRDTGTAVRLWGTMTAGIPDAGSTQIELTRIEILEGFSIIEASATPIPQGEVVQPDASWQIYRSEYFGFQFQYPPEAQVTGIGVQRVSPEDVPEGMGVEEVMAQVQEKYGDNLCIQVQVDLGYIYISTPANTGGRYTPCGRTGVGVGDLIPRQENIWIEGALKLSEGYEFNGGGKLLPEHNETFVIELPGEYRVEFGALPVADQTYSAYQRTARPVLLGILSTFVTQ